MAVVDLTRTVMNDVCKYQRHDRYSADRVLAEFALVESSIDDANSARQLEWRRSQNEFMHAIC